FAPDGRTLLSVGRDRTLCSWDVATGKGRHHFRIPNEQHSHTLLLSPDGRLVVIGWDNNHELILWDAVARKRLARLTSSRCCFLSAAFSPDGKSLAAPAAHYPANEIRVHVWEVPSGRERF